MKSPDVLTRSARVLSSALFPHHCELCEASTLTSRLPNVCDACTDALPRITAPFCHTCHEPFDGALEETFVCPNCRGQTFTFDYNRSALRYSEKSSDLIHSLKYGKNTYLARDLSAFLTGVARSVMANCPEDKWAIVPIPLHWTRRFGRGFNQADELARLLRKSLNLPLYRAVRRSRRTANQAHLRRSARQKNLKSAFTVPLLPRSLAGQSIFLVDDVFTTGSTADACARVLRQECNAEKVIVLTVMRG